MEFGDMYKFIVFIASAALWLPLQSKGADSAPQQAKLLFEQAVSSDTVPGISVAVGDTNGTQWAKGFGYSDLESKVPMTKKTKLRIGSVSKVITAAALMRLVEQGVLNLDSEVRLLVPDWPETHPAISLRQLTNHTSGIRDYIIPHEFLSNVQYNNTLEALNIFKNDPLLFVPGSDQSYSTYNWTLLSAAMESAKGETFKEIVSTEVFEPLGLKRTTFDDAAPIIPSRQGAYSFFTGVLINSPEVNSSYKYAGGGILSTPKDVVKFALSHLKPGFLQEESISELFTNSKLSDGTETNIGIGWFLGGQDFLAGYNSEEYADIRRILEVHPNLLYHTGLSIGSTSVLILCPEHQRAVTVIKNVDLESSADLVALALKTLDLFHSNEQVK
ncbi:beta-lactamase family protein [Microbulbifer variabilis]|uniref:Beta-lactamase family protein n=1 Tax=Microbulbifer variabilis TaxID=266805 RepID=A0ABY4VL95_9GAMM|nr:serine hydrolase domain-containing protein [Microbulbifer variabilis]USD23207.1 beta-lactamase family protein [Microbulbifer variabilis]